MTFAECQPVKLEFNSPDEADRLYNILSTAFWFEPDLSNRHLLLTLQRVIGLQKWGEA